MGKEYFRKEKRLLDGYNDSLELQIKNKIIVV